MHLFYQNHILEAICDLGEEYKQTLKDYYKDNTNDLGLLGLFQKLMFSTNLSLPCNNRVFLEKNVHFED